MNRQIVPIETDKYTPIPWNLLHPRYSDKHFDNGEQTVYLDPNHELCFLSGSNVVNGAIYKYSDRLDQLDCKKSRRSFQDASENFIEGTPALYEDYLRRYHEDPALKLVHIIAGINRSNAYPYRIYGFILPKNE
ncbi:TPA: hypothetical protein GX533_02130 [Candidatus Dojkabacteria bacterium]|uniref:Uncharacterized protein n=1 Tax=Candidatus Dojkabacteria bacterium TaxID=2099670 RepID=A0A832QCA5_9BACT|nr:hypothetical protein [Candidatus Dojkabacteria bacterium]